MRDVTFMREFRHRSGPGTIRVYPAGWAGSVDDEVAVAATHAGAVRGTRHTAPADAAGEDGNAPAKAPGSKGGKPPAKTAAAKAAAAAKDKEGAA